MQDKIISKKNISKMLNKILTFIISKIKPQPLK